MNKSALEILKEKAVEKGMIEGYQYLIVTAPGKGALNGYIVFPKRPVREQGYSGILTYVPVHGGITYANPDKKAMIYGFDTLHCDSEKYPRADKNWIKGQIKVMLKGILKAKEVEDKYLRRISSKGKAKYAQMVLDIQPEMDKSFGVNINLMCGKI